MREIIVFFKAANLRIGVLERPVRGHVFDDVSHNGVDLTFLKEKEKTVRKEKREKFNFVVQFPNTLSAVHYLL